MALLGTLQVRMGLDVAEFEVELKKVPKGIEGATSKLGGMLGGVGGAVKALGVALAGLATIGAAKAFGEMILGANDLTDSLNDASTRLGIGIGNLQVWEATAKRAGIGTEELEALIKKFNKTTGEIKLNESSEQVVNAFKRIGISVAEVKNSTPDDLLNKAVTGLAKIQDPAVRATTAMQLFGKQGAQALTLVADGADGLQRSKDLLEKTGLALNDIDASKVGEANDALDDLGTVAQAAKQKLGAYLAPAISSIGEMLLDAGKNGHDFGKDIADAVDGAVKGLDRLWSGIRVGFNASAQVFHLLESLIQSVASTILDFGADCIEVIGQTIPNSLNEFLTSAGGWITSLKQGFEDVGTAISNAITKAMNLAGEKTTGFINSAIEGLNTLISKANEMAGTNFEIVPRINWKNADLKIPEQVAPFKFDFQIPGFGQDLKDSFRDYATLYDKASEETMNLAQDNAEEMKKSVDEILSSDGGKVAQWWDGIRDKSHEAAKKMTEDYSGGNGVPAKTEHAMKHMTEKVLEQFNIIEEAGKKVTDSLSSAIDDFVKNGQLDFKKLTTSIIQELAALSIKSTILGGILGNPKFGGNGSGIFGGSSTGNLISGYLSGFSGVPKAIPLFKDANGNYTDIATEHYTNAPYNAGNGTSSLFGGLGSIFSGILKAFSFDGGGYTGDGGRSGGVDGKGGFLSILHPRETVTDHTKVHAAAKSAQRGRQAPQINMPISIAPGVSRTELSVSLQEVQKNIIEVLPKMLNAGGRYASSFGQ